MGQLDEIDLAILHILQDQGRLANVELAERVGLKPSSVLRRVKLLEERGYICGYSARLDPLLLGQAVTAFIFVEGDQICDSPELMEALRSIPAIQEIHRVIGEWCLLLKVRTSTPQALEQLLHRQVRALAGVRRTLTILATSSPHETSRLDLSGELAAAGDGAQ